MTTLVGGGAPPVAGNAALEEALTEELGRHFGLARRVVALQRRLAPYHASFYLEEVDLEWDSGATMSLVFKDLGSQLESARRVKPAFLYDPTREIEAYQTVLATRTLGTPICYGTSVRPDQRRFWLFLERIDGTRLRELGDFELWLMAARWLATLHAAPVASIGSRRPSALLVHDRAYLGRWLSRAVAVVGDRSGGDRQSIDWLAERYEAVLDRLASLPVSFIHGEFYPSNILIRSGADGPEVCAVDWEMAGFGPGLVDLAALVSGWSDAEAEALARSYFENIATAAYGDYSDFSTALDCCRLQLAVQWLGWSHDWAPPPEHVHNWLTTASTLAHKLGF
jgi:hypothetical protein